MSQYSKVDIQQWILGHFPVKSKSGSELNFPCPQCGHPAFYFNVKKAQGFCHRAGCQATYNLESMIDEIGYGPELSGYVPGIDKKQKQVIEVTLPKGARPIESLDLDVDALTHRGVDWASIQKFNIHSNKTHIVIPIYEENNLVQYNSRRINRNAPPEKWFSAIGPDTLRYKYAPGRPITNYFLGWEECRLWDKIVLVENSFVAIALRDLEVTTNFGSYLSDRQVDMLLHSNVKNVTFLWDEGANSQKAERKLRKVGVACNSIYITGQPDDHDKEEIEELLK